MGTGGEASTSGIPNLQMGVPRVLPTLFPTHPAGNVQSTGPGGLHLRPTPWSENFRPFDQGRKRQISIPNSDPGSEISDVHGYRSDTTTVTPSIQSDSCVRSETQVGRRWTDGSMLATSNPCGRKKIQQDRRTESRRGPLH